MKGQFVKYIHTLGDCPTASTNLTLEQDYQILGEGNIVKQGDSYRIENDKGQQTFYLKQRFSEPFNK